MNTQKLLLIFLISIFFFWGTKITFSQNFWEPTDGPPGTIVLSLAINPSGHIFAGTANPGAIFRSTDNGGSWTEVYSTAPGRSLAINSSEHIFAGTDEGVFRSTDNGESWTPINTGLTHLFISRLVITSSDDILAGTAAFDNAFGHVFRSTDNGESWAEIYAGLPVRSLAINSSEHIFAGVGTGDGGVLRSTDNGKTWTQINTGLTHLFVSSLAVNSNGYIFAGTFPGSLFRSTDNGDSWTQVLGSAGADVPSLAINSSAYVFAGTFSAGVFRSTDNGTSWAQINAGLTNINVLSLAINSAGFIFAGTAGDGVFISVQSTTSVREIDGEIPLTYTLEQNYPNPFNPFTTIRFLIPEESFVTIKVFNTLGEEITTLINENIIAGNYEVEFSVTALPSGIYFYRLQAAGFIETKKMVLMK